jgi:hypothetical protein
VTLGDVAQGDRRFGEIEGGADQRYGAALFEEPE